MVPVLINLIVFGSVTAVVIVVAVTRYRVRKEMVIKGPVSLVETPAKTGSKTLLFGLFCIAIGLAVFITAFIHYYDRHIFAISLFWLFGGGAMLAYWKITSGDREQACNWYERILNKKCEDPQQNAVQ